MKFNNHLSRQTYRVSIVLCLLLASMIFLGNWTFIFAGDADDLAKSANRIIRNAERNMHGGKNDQAAKLLEEARKMLDDLEVADPSHRQIKSLENKYARTKKMIDKKPSKTASESNSPSVSSTSAMPGQSSGAKLPSGVAKRIRDINHKLDRVDHFLAGNTESSIKQADYKINETQSIFDEIDDRYGKQFDTDHMDYTAVKERFDTLKGNIEAAMIDWEKRKADAEAGETAKNIQSAEWIPKFQAFLSYPGNEGHDPNLLVYIPGTSEPEKFADAHNRYEKFKDFYEAYKEVDFPHGINWKLETLAEQDAPQRLADFENQFADRVGSVTGEAEKQISQAMEQLEKDNDWKTDSSIKPPLVDRKRMTAIDDLVKKVNAALGSESPESARINNIYAALAAKDREYRKIRAGRTFLSPDIYTGVDKKVILEKANAIVLKEMPASKVLRITIYRDAWEEKTVEGWADTTKTNWEKKTFQQINAHVGARDASGVYLHTLHIAKDKINGGWGSLYGHIMYSDTMSETNVNK